MKKIVLITILTMLSTAAYAERKATIEDAYRDMKIYGDAIKAATANATPEQLDYDWRTYVSLSTNNNDLEAKTATNGYVILNKSQGLIKQWGRVNLASRGTATVKFPHRMSNVYSINLTSSNAHLSNSGDGTIETSTRVSGYTSDQFKIVRGYVGDSKGHIGSVTVYWEATGKL